MVGINCAACHVNEIEYKGKRIRVDGAPNMFDIAGFYAELKAAVEEVLQPEKSLRFLERLRQMPAGFSVDGIHLATFNSIQDLLPVPATKATLLENAEYIREHASLAASYITMLARFDKAHVDLALGDTVPGFGRADAFGTARILLFGPVNRITLDAPVSFPHLWGINTSRWIHWVSNTNSVMQRNIGEALGLGASANTRTGESTIRLDNLHKLETLAYKITPPEWPEDTMGAIQHDRATRGKALYDARCWGCHDDYGASDAAGRFAYRVFKPGEIGTDPMEAINFAQRLRDGRQFARAQVATLSSIANWYYSKNDVSPETQAEWNSRRGPEVWRDMTDMDGNAYTAKPLAGVWATAPYLHNGSVPTLLDLLSPQVQRPASFSVGQREYDPEKVGYLQSAKGSFLFDTSLPGNGNYGHEIPGTLKWTDDQKLDLIEFLKTISGRVTRGPYQVIPSQPR